MPDDLNSMRIPYLMKRGDSLRYRRIVPEDVRDALGGKVVWSKTYKPSVGRQAVVADADRLARHHDDLVARARSGEVLDAKVIAESEKAARAMTETERLDFLAFVATAFEQPGDAKQAAFVNAVRNGGRYVPGTLTIKTAHENDLKSHGDGRDERPFDYAVHSFVKIAGSKDVREITRADAIAWRDAQREEGLAESTIARRANSLAALLTRTYLDLDIAKPNPFSKLGVSGKGDASDKLPFTKAHLKLIDTHIRESRAEADTKNLLRLLKFTGTGPAEMGGVVLEDFVLDHDIPHVRIRANELRGLKAKKGKQHIRARNLPLIGEALEAARDAVQRAKGNPRGQVFMAFNQKRGADIISATLNKAIRAAGVPLSKRLTAYSFRHGLIEAMKQVGIGPDLRRLIAGHSAKDHHDRYGSPSAPLSDMRDALLKAVPLLGNVDESVYTADELKSGQANGLQTS